MGKIKLWQIALLAGITALLALFYNGLWQNPSFNPSVLIDTPAPGFKGPDLFKGTEVSYDQFKGKVIVLNFWASWCLECRTEHANLLDLNRRFGNLPNFVLLGADYQDKEAPAKEYLKEMGNSFQHFRDVTGRISIDYGVYGVPETFVIDPRGIIRYKEIGPLIGETYRKLTDQVLEPLLKGQPISAQGT